MLSQFWVEKNQQHTQLKAYLDCLYFSRMACCGWLGARLKVCHSSLRHSCKSVTVYPVDRTMLADHGSWPSVRFARHTAAAAVTLGRYCRYGSESTRVSSIRYWKMINHWNYPVSLNCRDQRAISVYWMWNKTCSLGLNVFFVPLQKKITSMFQLLHYIG